MYSAHVWAVSVYIYQDAQFSFGSQVPHLKQLHLILQLISYTNTMSITSMPFLTGPVASTQEQLRLSPPRGRLSAVVPLSKVQEVLWVDYLRQPWTTHYNLTLKIDLTRSKLTLEGIMNSKSARLPKHKTPRYKHRLTLSRYRHTQARQQA